MVLDGHVFTVPDGVRGFDANLIIPPNAAAAFIQRGYRFCVRYVRRQTVHDFDLTPYEADGLIGAGLGLMVVQHVESETAGTPTAAKGAANGDVAATEAQQIGIPPGGMVWCDLEGVTGGTPAAQVIDYCNRWHAAGAGAGDAEETRFPAASKLVFNFNSEGQSRRYVHRFFKEICGDAHRERLSQAFHLSTFLSYEKAVEFRYDIRRDVVHTGVYFRTSLLPSPESTPGLTRWKHKGHTVISSRTLPQRSYGTLCSKAPWGAKRLVDG